MPFEKRSVSPLRLVFGTQLRAARQARGMTIADLAYAARVDWSYLTQIEAGRKNASLDVLDALATAVGVSLIDLLQSPIDITPENEVATQHQDGIGHGH